MAGLDPECALVCAYVPPAGRRRLLVLWRLDATLGRIATMTREPALAAMKLLWWRDALAALDGGTPPSEPVLREVAAALLPAGISGNALSGIEAGWAAILPGEESESAALARYAADRGGRLFDLGATILGGAEDQGIRAAGEGWALVDLARRWGPGESAERALAEARLRFGQASARRCPRPLRPLGMLAALARADAGRPAAGLRRQGGPLRIARMARHRLTGY